MGEFLEGCSCFSLSKDGGANGGSIVDGETPQMGCDSFRPVVFGEEKHGSCRISKVANSFLGNTVSMMRIDTTETDALIASLTCGCVGLISKNSVVAMVVLDPDIEGFCALFETGFG